MTDTKIQTIRDRIRIEKARVEYCIRMTLPFAEHLEVIRFLETTLTMGRRIDE